MDLGQVLAGVTRKGIHNLPQQVHKHKDADYALSEKLNNRQALSKMQHRQYTQKY